MVKKAFKIICNDIKILKEILRKRTKGKIKTIKEILKYMKKYEINLEDYLSFQFYNMKEEEVATFFTYHMNDKFIDECNDKSKKYIFNNKELFDTIFNDYLGRKWIATENITYKEFENFVKRQEFIFYKKLDGSRGIGAKKINVKKYNNTRELYNYVKELDKGIIEEHIIAHKDINKICDSGLSTFRVLTLNKDGECKILECVFMIANGNIVNCEATGGGLTACVNLETGVVETDAVDINRNFYITHPLSGEPIKGFQVPYWNEVIKLVNEIYNKIPGINYIGWDIAITDNGPIVIEGNASWPSHRIWQVPYLGEKRGKKREFEEKIYEKKGINVD